MTDRLRREGSTGDTEGRGEVNRTTVRKNQRIPLGRMDLLPVNWGTKGFTRRHGVTLNVDKNNKRPDSGPPSGYLHWNEPTETLTTFSPVKPPRLPGPPYPKSHRGVPGDTHTFSRNEEVLALHREDFKK